MTPTLLTTSRQRHRYNIDNNIDNDIDIDDCHDAHDNIDIDINNDYDNDTDNDGKNDNNIADVSCVPYGMVRPGDQRERTTINTTEHRAKKIDVRKEVLVSKSVIPALLP
jgi:hypothetical protein